MEDGSKIVKCTIFGAKKWPLGPSKTVSSFKVTVERIIFWQTNNIPLGCLKESWFGIVSRLKSTYP